MPADGGLPRRTPLPRVAATGVLLLILAACSSDPPASGDGRAAAPPPATPATPARTAAEEPADPVSTPTPPPTTAGTLAPRDLPTPRALGTAWQPYVDPGGAEAGFIGNDSWVRARSPRDVVDGLAPVGCLGVTAPPRLPAPDVALEGTYVSATGEGRGVALTLEFRTPALAAQFLAVHRRVTAACPEPRGGVGPDDPLVLVIVPQRPDRTDAVVAERRELGAGASNLTWTEVVIRAGRRVGLLTVGTPDGTPRPSAAALERALRAALRA